MGLIAIYAVRLFALAWFFTIVWAGFLIVSRIAKSFRAGSLRQFRSLFVPTAALIAVTIPLWIEGAYLDLKCKRAQSPTLRRVVASNEGLYWRSRATEPNSGSGGFSSARGSDTHNAFARSAIRAVAEGRIAYLVMPFTTNEDQKLFLARRSSAHECLSGEVHDAWGHLPSHLCIAWEHAGTFPARYEVRGSVLERYSDDEVAIRDRHDGSEVARFAYASKIAASDTLLSSFGIRSYQPAACRWDLPDRSKLTSLVLLTFTMPDDTLKNEGNLREYLSSPWQIKLP